MRKCLLIPLFALLLTACGGGTTLKTSDAPPQTPETVTPSSTILTLVPQTTPSTTINSIKPRPIPTTTSSTLPQFQTSHADAVGFRTPLGDCTTTDLYTAERYGLTYDPTCPVVK